MKSDRGDPQSTPPEQTDSDQAARPRWGLVYGEASLLLFFGLLGGFLAWAVGFSDRLVLGLLFVGLAFSVVLVLLRLVRVGKGGYSQHPEEAIRRSTLDKVASAIVTAVTLILAFLWILGAFPSLVRGVNGVDLVGGDELWIERGQSVGEETISSGPRIGVRGDDWALTVPWRFWIAGNGWVSRG